MPAVLPSNNVYDKNDPWKDCEWAHRSQGPMWPRLNRNLISLGALTSYSHELLFQELASLVHDASLCQSGQHPSTHVVLPNWRWWKAAPGPSRKLRLMLSCQDTVLSCRLHLYKIKRPWCQVTAYWIPWVCHMEPKTASGDHAEWIWCHIYHRICLFQM